APPPGRYAIIAVADTGEGMSREVLLRAQEPFFTTKGPGRGSGLGLSQVAGMAQQLGGGLTIDSERGKGAVIRIYLPLAAAGDRLSSRADASAAPTAGLGPLTALLVDDDDAVRQATADLLVSLGCKVIEAQDGP